MTLFIKLKRSYDPFSKRWGFNAISENDSSFAYTEEKAIRVLLNRNPVYSRVFIERYSIFTE